MDRAKEYFWNESVKFLEDYYSGYLKYPLESYFYIEDRNLFFKDKPVLHHDVKKMVITAFNALYE
jgi:hypothetical protein